MYKKGPYHSMAEAADNLAAYLEGKTVDKDDPRRSNNEWVAKEQVLADLGMDELYLNKVRNWASKHAPELLIDATGGRYKICLSLRDLTDRNAHGMRTIDGTAGDSAEFNLQFQKRTGISSGYIGAFLRGWELVRWAVQKTQDEIGPDAFPTEDPYAEPEEQPTDPAVIRAWAKEQGIPISDRARVSGAIRERYRLANSHLSVVPS